MRSSKLFVGFCLLFLSPVLLHAQHIMKPFPQHVHYYAGTIIPNHITQQEMDDSVRSFYKVWKERYINNDCGHGQYYVWFEKDRGTAKCVSEGQGYGMVIVALMAGFDDSAKIIYDGLYTYYKAHPSKTNSLLMSWSQDKNFKDAATSATDGDLDIAYSLLLANAQWGSNGAVNYLSEAQKMIKAIMQHEINPKTFSVLLSDAVEPDSHDYFDTRSSDFMPAHFKAFKKATDDTNWDKVIDNNYKLFNFLQNEYSSEAGLVPDFITHIHTAPKPAPAKYLESRYDGYYNYNACRVPWRIATDFIINGDKRSEKFIEKINTWIKETTQQNPDNISAGYKLDGDDLKSRNFEALSFIAPFAVAAMVNEKNQLWLNKTWDYIIHFTLDEFDYYDNTIKMINLIILSGNYWAP